MKVLIADDHPLFLEGLANLLEAHGIEVAGKARDGLQAIELARWLNPDVILMDIRMPGYDGIAATRRIKAELPDAKIVMFTSSGDDHDLFEAVRCGAIGYLVKTMDADDLIVCLEQVVNGMPVFSPGVAATLLGEFARLSNQAKGAPAAGKPDLPPDAIECVLTAREREVLALVAMGLSYKEVAARLNLSSRTIKYHMAEIMERLDLANRTQAIAYAVRVGLAGEAGQQGARGSDQRLER